MPYTNNIIIHSVILKNDKIMARQKVVSENI